MGRVTKPGLARLVGAACTPVERVKRIEARSNEKEKPSCMIGSGLPRAKNLTRMERKVSSESLKVKERTTEQGMKVQLKALPWIS